MCPGHSLLLATACPWPQLPPTAFCVASDHTSWPQPSPGHSLLPRTCCSAPAARRMLLHACSWPQLAPGHSCWPHLFALLLITRPGHSLLLATACVRPLHAAVVICLVIHFHDLCLASGPPGNSFSGSLPCFWTAIAVAMDIFRLRAWVGGY